MQRDRVFYLLFILLFFTGCIGKYKIENSLTCKVVIKSGEFAIADMGFLKKAEDYKNLQIFTAGKVVLNIELSNNLACINSTCTTREDFNKRFFKVEHYKNIMDDILNGYPIYGGINLVKNSDGFTQNIKKQKFSIIYRVRGNSIYFKDKINRVLIKIERIY